MAPDHTSIETEHSRVKFQEHDLECSMAEFDIFGAVMTPNKEQRNSPSTEQRVAWDLKYFPEIAQQPVAVEIFSQRTPDSDVFDLPKAGTY